MISRKYACQNLSVRQWSLCNWKQRPTIFTHLFSMIQFPNTQYLLWSNHDCFILFSVLIMLEYLPFFIYSWNEELEQIVSGWHLGIYLHEGRYPWASWSWIRWPICAFCVCRLPESLRQGGISGGLCSKKGQSWAQTTLHKPVSFWGLKACRMMSSSCYLPPAPQEATLSPHPRSPC